MVTRGSPFSMSKLIFRFVSGVTLMERNPCELPFPIYALSHCLKKRSSTLRFVLTKWSRNQEWTTTVFLFVSVFGQSRKKVCGKGLKTGSMSWGICAGQDPLFKPCRALACLRHTAQEHEAVSRAGSLFRSMLYAFHEGNLTTTSADFGFTLHLIWCNCRLP